MNGSKETKSEIRARVEELEKISWAISQVEDTRDLFELRSSLEERLSKFRTELDTAQEDNFTSIIRSHKALCEVKGMDEKAAYGHDPAVYYTLGVCGEAGEMANGIVKAMRNGLNREKVLAAICSELPDVIIYSFVLAYVNDIDLVRLVNEKVDIVVKRAFDGYYGPPLDSNIPGALKSSNQDDHSA